MESDTKKTTTIAVRVPWNMHERITALRPMLDADNTSTVARTLMEYGMRALVQGADPLPEVEQSEAEAAAVLAYVRRELREQLGVLASHRPVTAVRAAMDTAGELVAWCEDLAERHGTNLAGLRNQPTGSGDGYDFTAETTGDDDPLAPAP